MNRKRTVKLNKIWNNEYKELRFKNACFTSKQVVQVNK